MAVDPATLKLIQIAAQSVKESKLIQYVLIGLLLAAACIFMMIASFFSFSTMYQTTTSGVSDNLVKYIEKKEGYAGYPYRGIDYQNVTIGYGHVVEPGESFTYLTQQQAQDLLVHDLISYANAVRKNFSDYTLTQNQFDALVSLCYNCGANIWPKINLTKDIKAGASPDVIKQDFSALDHCNGVEVLGLLHRREEEFEMFEYGKYAL